MTQHLIERIREEVNYDPMTGALTWKRDRPGTKGAGSSAGGLNRALGYIQLRLDGKLLYGHRVAYALMTGEFPQFVDHINGDKADNRWSNLRSATAQDNQENRRRANRNSSIGLIGVTRNHKRFMAHISVKSKTVYLGTYDTELQAHQAYLTAKREMHAAATI